MQNEKKTEAASNRKMSWLYLPVLILVISASSVWAQEKDSATELESFSEIRLKKISAEKPNPAKSENSASCLNFEATYSGPIKNTPTAILDVEQDGMLDGVISFIMKVTRIGNDKIKMEMETDPTVCEALLESDQDISVTLEDAEGKDDLDVLPDQQFFKVKKDRVIRRK